MYKETLKGVKLDSAPTEQGDIKSSSKKVISCHPQFCCSSMF